MRMAEISLPLDRMSLSEKMSVIERVWQSIDEAEFTSPAWHEAVLRDREEAVRRGEAKFSSWPEAKKRIRKRAREG